MLQQWAWTLCDEFCEPLGIDMQPGIHFPDKSDPNLSAITNLMSDMKVNDVQHSTFESNAVLSMTGVSIIHKKILIYA